MQTISTGYQPEFGLGAYFQGQNVANAETTNQADQIKALLEQMKAQQGYQQQERMNPLDVFAKEKANQVAEYDAAYAQKKLNDPDYMDANIRGQIGQMDNQYTSSVTAKALQPMKEAAERAALENAKSREGFQWTLNDLINKINQGGDVDENGNIVKATPSQMGFFQNKKNELTKLLAETPEYAQKDMLKDQQYAADLEKQQIRSQASIDAAELRAQASKKDAKYNEILMQQMQIVADPNATPQEKAVANQIIQLHRTNKLYSNPAAWQEGIDMSKLGIQMAPSVIDRANASSPSQPIVVNNAEEWNKLPKGTQYTTPDGRKGIK